jgi:hypothetical protein
MERRKKWKMEAADSNQSWDLLATVLLSVFDGL